MSFDMEQVYQEHPELRYAWLNVDVKPEELFNPLINVPPEFEEPEMMPMYISWLLTRPEYISFVCSEILKVNLLPMQALFYKEIWDKKFPMLIATRGYGKAIPLNTKCLTSTGWVKNGDLSIGDKIYGRDGCLHTITEIHPQGQKQIYRLKLLDGREIDCCEDHLWVVKNQTKEKTLSTKEMFEKGIKYTKKASTSVAYKYKIPNCKPIQYKKQVLPLDAYLLGCLLGDGCIKGHTPKIASDDEFIIAEFNNRLDGFEIKKDPTNNNHTIVDRNKIAIYNRLSYTIKELKLNVGTKDKFIPDIYKYGSIEDRFELVRGLLDTDGSIAKHGGIEFTNTCEQLVDDLIEVLRSLGITCKKAIDNREGQESVLPQGTTYLRRPYFRVFINTSQPVFKLPRKLDRIKPNRTGAEDYVSIVDIQKLDEYTEMQCITVDNPDHTFILKDHVVTHNSFGLAVYALLRALLLPGRKIAICGAAYRQSKVLFGYMEQIYNNSPILRDIVNSYPGTRNGPFRGTDICGFRIGESVINCFPLGDGEKIRGQRAHDVIADEFGAINREIFETVIAGFAIVSSNPFGNVQREAAIEMARERNIILPAEIHKVDEFEISNQIIISGTAYYTVNHFAEYWRMWKARILSRGDMNLYYKYLKKDVESIDVEEKDNDANTDWKDYCIFRIPYEKVPKGFMDEGQRNRAKATIDKGTYEMEYGAVFSKDSNGFFKYNAIEAASTDPKKTFYPWRPDGGFSHFSCVTRGRAGCKYVMGVDPASEVDRFSIIIIEIHEDHKRIVYGWSTNKAEHRDRITKGQLNEHNYYAWCARKIRELTKAFNVERIAIDAGGGGIAIEEALRDTDKINIAAGEKPFWPIVDDDKEKDSDWYEGPKILEMVNFANYKWLAEANHSLKKDITEKTILFPYYDTSVLVTDGAIRMYNEDGTDVVQYDTIEDIFEEIKELKEELTTIVVTITPSGRESWDTPDIKQANGKKGKAKKDRYSALLLANMAARAITPIPFTGLERTTAGDFAGIVQSKNSENVGYKTAPDWMKREMDNSILDAYGSV